MNDTENYIKETLERRRIKPSAESWAQLSYELDGRKNRMGSRVYWISGLAASFLIGVLVAGFYFKTKIESSAVEQHGFTGKKNKKSQREDKSNAEQKIPVLDVELDDLIIKEYFEKMKEDKERSLAKQSGNNESAPKEQEEEKETIDAPAVKVAEPKQKSKALLDTRYAKLDGEEKLRNKEHTASV